MNKKNYKNWLVEQDADQVVWLRFDRENSSVNSINIESLNELEEIINEVSKNNSTRGLIIASAKKTGFIAGADVEQFTKITNTEEALTLINKGQSVLNLLEELKIPTVAMIDGFCLGGGCELVLACRYRVAEDSQKTKIGLPEILLGLHPGWGGSVRLPRLIGAPAAMDLILTGRAVNGKTAKQLGIVDAVVPKRSLERAAKFYALTPPKPHRPKWWQSLTNQAIVRTTLGNYLYQKLNKKVNPEHYPAPFAVVENWIKEGVDNEQKALQVEADSLAKIALTDTAHNLIRDFFLQDRLKSLGKESDFKAAHVHVIGAGTMGGDIAAWCALRGLQVTLQDQKPEQIAPAIKRAYDLFKKKLKVPRLIQAAMDRLTPDVHGLGIPKADVIIEAIYENLAVKQKLFSEIEFIAKPDAILATNTSSIPLDEINTALKNPDRLLGIHFFNPVPMMQLVEVVQGKITNPELIKQAIAFVRQIDRLPLPVTSHPGFLVNRVLMPYLLEAMILFEEGVPAPVIDKAAVDFGMPMGPLELADTVGLDVCLAVAKNLNQHLGNKVPDYLVAMVEQGRLGRKTKYGFYHYQGANLKKEKLAATQKYFPDVTERLIFSMLNESIKCLHEHVVADADLVDVGMIFGTGFAPFRGGPMHYAQSLGFDTVYEQLQVLSEKYGERFKPDSEWLKKSRKKSTQNA